MASIPLGINPPAQPQGPESTVIDFQPEKPVTKKAPESTAPKIQPVTTFMGRAAAKMPPPDEGEWVDFQPEGEWVDVAPPKVTQHATPKAAPKVQPQPATTFMGRAQQSLGAVPGVRLNPRTGLPMQDIDPTGKGITNLLPMIGAAGASAIAGPEAGIGLRMLLSTLGGAGGSAAQQKMQGSPISASTTAKEGLEYGAAPEAIGGVLVKAGESFTPTALKKLASSLFAGRMDVAGRAIDTYLSQPALSGIKVDVATPINGFLDKEIAQANRVGGKSLANRLTELKTDWNASYNLKSPTLAEANAFKREISKYTSFAGEANKVALNKIQKQVVGMTSDLIEKAALGIKPLNEAYSDLAGGAKAARTSVRKATSGFTGLGLSTASAGLRGAGSAAPNTLRAFLGVSEPSSKTTKVP